VNDPFELSSVVALCGEAPAVVIEATYGWYWAVDLLQDLGAVVHLANPNALNWGDRRVKNDEIDAHDLADMLRLGRLPEAWIAPPAVRELRELVRYRAKLVQLRSGLKAQVHAVMAKEGVLPKVTDIFGSGGTRQLDALELGGPFAHRVASLRELIAVYDREVATLERDIHQHLKSDRGYRAVQAINGIGKVSAAVLVAEIGDVSRFPTPAHLCSWCGLTPKHRESDLKTRRGRISKQGSRLIRATLIEGISRYHGGGVLDAQYQRIAKRRGRNKARVALARKVLTLVYYGLRDGEIRCLAPVETAA
jgi:transposase